MNVIGIMPWIWIVPAVAVLILAFAWFCQVMHDGREDDGWFLGAVFAWLIGGGMFITALVLAIPFQPQYWAYYRLTGTVQTVTNSFTNADGQLTGDTIATVDGRQVVLTDNRVMTLVGKRVDLTCTIQWVPYGEDQLSCFLGGVR